MTHPLANAMRREADMIQQGIAKPRTTTISSYDPNKHAVKVLMLGLNADTEESDWIPLGAIGVGNGFGFVCAPNIGDMVEVSFSGGSFNAPKIIGRYFSTIAVPPVVPAGATWLVHPSGSLMQFNNDGTVNITAAGTMTYTAPLHHFIGPVTMDNTLLVKQTVTGQGGITISGNNGTGAASTVTGTMNMNGGLYTTGAIQNNGVDIGSAHYHGNGNGGNPTTAPIG